MNVGGTEAAPPVRMPEGYEFRRVLGKGATALVVCAHQVSIGRLVAIKVVHNGSLDADATRRLEREGRVLAQLAHPNIVKILTSIPLEADLALVMEYAGGGSLADVLASGPVAPTDALRILAETSSALEHASAAGVAHRDIKPANLLFDDRGRVKVADFGLARLARNAAAFRTSYGSVTGTPRYMAPEQILDPDNEDARSDAYAYGVVAYRLLLGRFPFVTEDPTALLEANARRQPTDPRAIVVGFPDIAATALLGLLNKNSEARWTSGQFIESVRGISSSAWPSPPAGTVDLERWFTRRKLAESANGAADAVARRTPSGAPTQTELDAVGWVHPPVYEPPAADRKSAKRLSGFRRRGSRAR